MVRASREQKFSSQQVFLDRLEMLSDI